MASNYTLKTKDTGPPLVATLKDVNGIVDLTEAATVELRMKRAKEPAAPLIKITAEILSPRTKGEIRIKWIEANTATASGYEIEAKVIWTNGEKDSFPNNTYNEIEILPSVE